MNEAVPALGEIIGHRLYEMVRSGHITYSIYRSAISNGEIAIEVMRGYLDACFQLKSH